MEELSSPSAGDMRDGGVAAELPAADEVNRTTLFLDGAGGNSWAVRGVLGDSRNSVCVVRRGIVGGGAPGSKKGDTDVTVTAIEACGG